jgi:hypothetical protein
MTGYHEYPAESEELVSAPQNDNGREISPEAESGN